MINLSIFLSEVSQFNFHGVCAFLSSFDPGCWHVFSESSDHKETWQYSWNNVSWNSTVSTCKITSSLSEVAVYDRTWQGQEPKLLFCWGLEVTILSLSPCFKMLHFLLVFGDQGERAAPFLLILLPVNNSWNSVCEAPLLYWFRKLKEAIKYVFKR